MPHPPTLAVIGCGAIATDYHLPVLASNPEVARSLILVDPSLERARELATRFGTGGGVASDVAEVVDRIDGAVVAAPHALHHPICSYLLDRGIHTLCEKPLAETAEEATDLVARAEAGGARLAVNQSRRTPNYRRIGEMMKAGRLGATRTVTFLEGEVFDWPAASGSYFGLASRGRGVILDRGAHIMDLLCWWFGEGELVECRHDGMGGSEATASIHLRFGEVEAWIHLSWLARFENVVRVECAGGTIEVASHEQDRFRWGPTGRPMKEERLAPGWGARSMAREVVGNFLEVVAGNALPLIPGGDVLPSLRILDECYRAAVSFDAPWMASRNLEMCGG